MFYGHRTCSMIHRTRSLDHRTCSMAIEHVRWTIDHVRWTIEHVLGRSLQGGRGAQPPAIAGGLGAARPQYCRGVWGAARPPIPKLKSCVLGGFEAPTKEKQPYIYMYIYTCV